MTSLQQLSDWAESRKNQLHGTSNPKSTEKWQFDRLCFCKLKWNLKKLSAFHWPLQKTFHVNLVIYIDSVRICPHFYQDTIRKTDYTNMSSQSVIVENNAHLIRYGKPHLRNYDWLYLWSGCLQNLLRETSLTPGFRVSALQVVRKFTSWHAKKPKDIWGTYREGKFIQMYRYCRWNLV